MTKEELTKAWDKIIRNSEYPIHYPQYITLLNPEELKDIANTQVECPLCKAGHKPIFKHR